MEEGTPFIELRINLKEPAALTDLVGAFAAIAGQFESFIRREHPSLKGAAHLLVKDIRHGSIVVELLPVIQPLMAYMDHALIVDGFVRRVGDLINKYIAGNRDTTVSKSEIKDLMNHVTLIANDPDGTSVLSSVEYHKTRTTTRLSVKFDTDGAKKIKETAQLQNAALDLPAYEVLENQLMVFVQTSIKPSETGGKTRLQAIVEAVSHKPLAVVFETDMARERVEGEIREDEKNVYKKGFFVDFYLEKHRGKPAVYRITAVRDIVPLPDEDE
jgi:hypothetical protein